MLPVAELRHAVAQGLYDTVLRPVSRAAPCEVINAEQLAEDHRDLLWSHQRPARGHRLVRTVDRDRYHRYPKVLEEQPNTWLKRLQIATMRASSLGEPDQVLPALQRCGTKGQARDAGSVRFDRNRLREPADKAGERVAEGHVHRTGPVRPTQPTVAQSRRNRERVQVAEVVGRHDERSLFRQVLETLDPQAEQTFHDRPVEEEQTLRQRRLHPSQRLEPPLLLFAQCLFGLFEWGGAGRGFAGLGSLGHRFEQVANGVDAVYGLLVQFHARSLADLHRVHAQVQLRTRVRGQACVGVAVCEQLPNLSGRRVFKETTVLFGHLLWRDETGLPFPLLPLTLFRPVVTVFEEVAAKLAKLRLFEWFASDGVVGEALVGRHPLRAFFDRLANRLFDVAVFALANLAQIRHDHRDEPPILLEHTNLADGWVGLVGCLDLLGLDVLAALGDDERRGPAGDVQVAIAVEVA